jgi:hypothetical protein
MSANDLNYDSSGNVVETQRPRPRCQRRARLRCIGPKRSSAKTGTAIHTGIATALVRELALSPEALERNLAELREAADGFLDRVPDRNTFTAAFDMLSESLQTKAFQVLRANSEPASKICSTDLNPN